MKAGKMLVCVLLLLALCLGMMSVTALAEGAVAEIDGAGGKEEMTSLADAVSSASPGDKVRLLQDCSLHTCLVIDKDLTLDLGGHEVTFTASDVQDAAILVKDGEVTIRNGVLLIQSEDEDAGYRAGLLSGKSGDLTLDNMMVRYAFPGGSMLSRSGGSVTVYEGRYSQDPGAYLPSGYEALPNGGMFQVSEKQEILVQDSSADSETEPAPTEDPAPTDAPLPTEAPAPTQDPSPVEDPAPSESPAPDVEVLPDPDADPNAPDEEKDPEAPGSVTNTDGSALSTIYYYKGGAGMGGDRSFTVKPEPDKVVLNGSTLLTKYLPADSTDPAQGGTLVIGEGDNKSILESIPAGACELEFQFKGAGPVKCDFYLFLKATLDTNRHVKNSGSPIVASITDHPDLVLVSDSSTMAGASTLSESTDYSYADGKLTLSSAYLDTLAKDGNVTKYVAFVIAYKGVNMAAPLAITILPPPSIDPTELSWKRGTEKSFTVKPDIVSASIDGSSVSEANYTAAGTKLTVKPGAIASLNWGEHTLTVNTTSGPVSAKIKVEPSLGYASNTGNQHTKGGSKIITFVASDPISRVYVNGTEISSEHYTIDGKNITLKASYLNTLKADTTYTITVSVTNNGNTADVSSSFKILSGGAGGSSGTAPQTGDGAAFLWMAILLLSCSGCLFTLPKLRRR